MSDTVHTMVQASNVDGRAPRIVPTGAALGARVEGLDLRGLDTAAFAFVHQAWLDHQVLLFRDQSLTDEDLLAFSRRFGDLDEAPVQESGRRFVQGHPEIYVVSNVVEHDVPMGSLGAGHEEDLGGTGHVHASEDQLPYTTVYGSRVRNTCVYPGL